MAIVDDYKEINRRARAISPHCLGEKRKACGRCSEYGWVPDDKLKRWVVCPACYNPLEKPDPTLKR